MAFEHYILVGQKRLRCGYTTGTCAALAAAGAARLLLSGEPAQGVTLDTPKGWPVTAEPAFCTLNGDTARCGVVKDAGDDPDVTDGCLICAQVRRIPAGIAIDGGAGVGRVTKPGLDQPVGAAAVNTVPRRMIAEAVRRECVKAGYNGGLSVVITVPDGERLAARTFNPQMGIEGGISILGTSGVVEPMSEAALVESVCLEIRQAYALGARRLILTPGNYGADFLNASGYVPSGELPCVRCSNFVGDALDCAAAGGFPAVLLVGHVGKFVKLAGGIMNTHSHMADCRGELFCAHAALQGADAALCRELMDAATTDACLELLDGAGLRRAVLDSLLSAIDRHVSRRAGPMGAGVVLFSNRYGFLGMTDTARDLVNAWEILPSISRRIPAPEDN